MLAHRTFRRLGAATPGRTGFRARLHVEGLEDRTVPAGGDAFHAMVFAGSPNGSPADSAADRVDPNESSSPYAGVGAIEVITKTRSFIGTGTVIGGRQVLTAAHVVDINNDGKVDRKDALQGVYFVLNIGGDQTAKIAVTGFDIAPDFTGFNRPAVNDDLVVLTLAEDVPAGTPTYQLPMSELETGTTLTFVGYGRSGDGVHGYTTQASPSVKRTGENTADAFYGQDDKGKPEANEVFRFDFDGPGGSGRLGGPTLGNNLETQLGSGDSGGPAFANTENGLVLAGVVTFTQGANAPRFGSMGGGINLYAYSSFVRSVMDPPGTSSSDPPPPPITRPPGPGVGIGANPIRNPVRNFPPPPPDRKSVV